MTQIAAQSFFELIGSFCFNIIHIEEESFLDKELNKFDDNIIHFKIINNSPELNTKSSGYISLSQFGEGIKHFINIIISIYTSKNGCLFID